MNTFEDDLFGENDVPRSAGEKQLSPKLAACYDAALEVMIQGVTHAGKQLYPGKALHALDPKDGINAIMCGALGNLLAAMILLGKTQSKDACARGDWDEVAKTMRRCVRDALDAAMPEHAVRLLRGLEETAEKEEQPV